MKDFEVNTETPDDYTEIHARCKKCKMNGVVLKIYAHRPKDISLGWECVHCKEDNIYKTERTA